MERKGIDELLGGTPDESPIEDAAPEPVVEASEPEAAPADEGQPRDESGRFAPKQTGVDEAQPPTEAAPPAADHLPKDVYEPLKAVRNENRELKAQIAAIQQQLAQQPPAQQAQEPDFWDNPQGVIASQVQRAVIEALQAQKQQQTMERINESELAAKARHDDYEDAFRAFQQAATANPTLVQQMTAASDPAEFAYSKGKTALQLEQVGSIDELLKTERAKWEAEARAAIQPPPQTFPSTTATDGSVGSRGGPEWGGRKSLEGYLGQ